MDEDKKQKMKDLLYLLFLLLFSSCFNDTSIEIVLNELPDDQREFQKMVIGQLSGEKTIRTEDEQDILIKSRWTPEEKRQTKAYLQTLIKTFGLEPLIHSYAIPNQNFGVDLLIEPLKGQNLYTIMPSTIPSDEYVVLGAHYDTGGVNVPGAIDNGSGMALILSVLRLAQRLESRNKNLMIVFFDQEEEDLSAGSIAFAQYLKSKNFDVHSVHTYDLIGWDGDDNREVELALPSVSLERIYKRHASRLGIPTYVTTVNSSDHYSFIQEGFEALCMSQAYVKKDNSGKKDTHEDKYHLVNFEFLSSSTNLAFEVIKDILHD